MILLSSLPESYAHFVTIILYGKETLILEEVTSTLLLLRLGKDQIKRSRQDQIWWSREGKEEEKEEKVQTHQRCVTFFTGKVIESKHQQEWLKKKGQVAEADVASNIEDTERLMAYYEDNTSQGKGWIFDSGSTVHVCYQKELFNNSLVANEEGIAKMVDGSACEVIDTGTINVTERDGMMQALEAVWYIRRHSGMSRRNDTI